MGSLFEEIGDAATLRTAVNLFYRRVLADPGLAPWFAGVDMRRLRAHQLAFLAGGHRLSGRPTGRQRHNRQHHCREWAKSGKNRHVSGSEGKNRPDSGENGGKLCERSAGR